MAVTVTKKLDHKGASGSLASVTPTSGKRLLVCCGLMIQGSGDPSSAIAISDTQGRTWTSIGSVGGGDWGIGQRAFIASAGTGTATSITLTCPGFTSYHWEATVLELDGESGETAGVVTDSAMATDGAASVTLSTAPATGDLVICQRYCDTGTNDAAPHIVATGWTIVSDQSDSDSNTGGALSVISRGNSTSTTVSVTDVWTHTNYNWKTHGIAFVIREASGGGSVTSTVSSAVESRAAGSVAVSTATTVTVSPGICTRNRFEGAINPIWQAAQAAQARTRIENIAITAVASTQQPTSSLDAAAPANGQATSNQAPKRSITSNGSQSLSGLLSLTSTVEQRSVPSPSTSALLIVTTAQASATRHRSTSPCSVSIVVGVAGVAESRSCAGAGAGAQCGQVGAVRQDLAAAIGSTVGYLATSVQRRSNVGPLGLSAATSHVAALRSRATTSATTTVGIFVATAPTPASRSRFVGYQSSAIGLLQTAVLEGRQVLPTTQAVTSGQPSKSADRARGPIAVTSILVVSSSQAPTTKSHYVGSESLSFAIGWPSVQGRRISVAVSLEIPIEVRSAVRSEVVSPVQTIALATVTSLVASTTRQRSSGIFACEMSSYATTASGVRARRVGAASFISEIYQRPFHTEFGTGQYMTVSIVGHYYTIKSEVP